MPTTTTTQCPEKSARKLPEAMINAFWGFTANRDRLDDSERLLQITEGFSAHLFRALQGTFDLQDRDVELLLNASISTLERRRREQKTLGPVASERLDRIAALCLLAEKILESRETVERWMSKTNKALGGNKPILHCETEIGARQVRRVLQAIEWGGCA
jgi:putative toxin-antitoxin system antitoxin component (TIGR02293 family)